MQRALRQRSTRATIAVALLTAVVLAGCGTNSAGPSSKESEIERVPLPLSADEMERYRHPGYRAYLVPTMSFAELVDWYDRAMPERRDFMDWEFCAIFERRDKIYRVYQRGEVGALVVELEEARDGVSPAVWTFTDYEAQELREDEC